MKKYWQVWEFLGFISLLVTILTLAIALTINCFPLYFADIHFLNIQEATGLTAGVLMKNYAQLMAFLNLPWVTTLKMTNFPSSFSGEFHFEEVKQLFLLDYGLLLVTIIPTIFFIRYLVRHKRLWRVSAPFKIIMVIPVLFAILMSFGFDQFFEQFHGVFFNNDAWLFNPATDPVINALPEAFFMHCFVLFFVLFEGLLVVGVLLGRRDLIKK